MTHMDHAHIVLSMSLEELSGIDDQIGVISGFEMVLSSGVRYKIVAQNTSLHSHKSLAGPLAGIEAELVIDGPIERITVS